MSVKNDKNDGVDTMMIDERWLTRLILLKVAVQLQVRTDWPQETYDHISAMTDWLFRGELHDFPTWREQVVEIVANSGFCV